jgi:DNA-binding Xre family transcriptional regulator
MAIIINIDVMLAKRKMSVTELADKVGITMANISVLSLTDGYLCRCLDVQNCRIAGLTPLVP